MPATEALYTVALDGPLRLCSVINKTITNGAPDNWTFGKIYAFNLKFVVTPLLTFLLLLGVIGYANAGGALMGESNPAYWERTIQGIGMATVIVLVILVVVGMIWPELYKDPKNREGKKESDNDLEQED